MSMYCPECTMLSYDEFKCEHCGAELIKERYGDVPKHKKPMSLNKHTNKVERNYNIGNPIVIVLVTIITISLGYLAFDKYQERESERQEMIMIFGTDDPDQVMKMLNKGKRDMNNAIKQSQKEYRKAMKSLEENRKKMNNMFK